MSGWEGGKMILYLATRVYIIYSCLHVGTVVTDRNPTTKLFGSLGRVMNINMDRPVRDHTLNVRVTHFKSTSCSHALRPESHTFH